MLRGGVGERAVVKQNFGTCCIKKNARLLLYFIPFIPHPIISNFKFILFAFSILGDE